MALPELFGQAASQVAKVLPFRKGGVNSEDPSGLIAELDERLDRAKESRRPYEGQWLVNMSFYFNKQWVIYSTATQQLEKPAVEPWRVMPNINFIRPAVITAFSKIVKDRQEARTQPAGPNPEDEAAARACDKLLNYLWPTSKADEAMRKATVWMLITGTGLLKACWDKSWGPIVGNDPETGDPVYLGENQAYSISPFDFYGEPGCLEIDEMEWCFHVTIRPASYVKKIYNVDVDETDYDNSMTYESQLKYIISGDATKTKGVLLKEYYERPNKDNPEGRFVVYVNDQVVDDKPNPYKDNPIPFIPIRGLPRPDSFWGISFIDDMIDPQRVYNKTKGESIEIQRLMSKPKRLIPIGSVPDGKEITNAPGEDIRYLPVSGLKPEVEKGADIPQGYFKVLDHTRQELYDASGQHEVSHGQSPFTRTASGIAYLQEQDDTRLATMIRNYDKAYELLAAYMLDIAREYYDETRTFNVLGDDKKVEVVTFYKNQIPNDVHVHLQAGGQALPRSRVARQDFILKLWTTQPPLIEDPRMVLKLLEFGEIEGIFDQANRDISQAARENDALLQGQPTDVRDFHNHLIHIKEHDKVRNSLAYEALDPQAQTIFDSHVILHKQQYAQQLMAMQQNAEAASAMGKASFGGPSKPGEGAPRRMGEGMGPLHDQPSPPGLHNAGQPSGGGNQ